MKINWRFIIIEFAIIFLSIVAGKVSASYEGCYMLNNHLYLIRFLFSIMFILVVMTLFVLLKDYMFIKEEKI